MSTEILIQRILDNIVNPIILLMVVVSVVVFLWGVFQFIRNAESSEERKKGGLHILWGSVGLFIMVTAYGILNLILGTIGK
jgi:ABC-type phosphate transport system permease subunit